jgi:hypothetical protein
MALKPDIVIFGAGIAGLWTFHVLKRLGYDVLLLEREAIGAGQTVASQGIIHSGLKFSLAGKINTLAKTMSEMPQVWRDCLAGSGPVDLQKARIASPSQLLLVTSGFIGGLTKMVTQKALGESVREIPQTEWPEEIKSSGFKGSVIFMNELVLDIPSVLHALAAPYMETVRKIGSVDPFDFLKVHDISPQKIIFTAARSNAEIGQLHGHHKGLQTQARPLMQGIMKNAPFPLFAHLVGTSDKPVATITTHKTSDGALVWYLGGGVAERSKTSDPHDVYDAACKAFKTYLPEVSFDDVVWATLPIDRIEGKSQSDHWMPDMPTIHDAGEAFYCWPTKLTFAPMLARMIEERLKKDGIMPSGARSDFSFLPSVGFATAPWDNAIWTK